jgi:putative transposase
MQAKCRGLYNWWVMLLRNGERWNFEQAKKSLRESKRFDPELRSVYGKLLAKVYFRLHGAMQGFFRHVQAGEKPGFPGFKPRYQFFNALLSGHVPGHAGEHAHPPDRRRW